MAVLIEDHLPVVKYHGLNTAKAVDLSAATLTLPSSQTLTTPNIGAATGTSLSLTGSLTAVNAGANTAGGNTTAAVLMGTSTIGIYFGDGAPTISAAKGSLYLNFTGSSTSTRLYVNNGTTNWVAVTTAS